jgi:hypothetical protein
VPAEKLYCDGGVGVIRGLPGIWMLFSLVGSQECRATVGRDKRSGQVKIILFAQLLSSLSDTMQSKRIMTHKNTKTDIYRDKATKAR